MFLLPFVCAVPLLGQGRDSSLDRIRVALDQPLPVGRGAVPAEGAQPKTFGILTLVPPTLPGEMIRVSIPIGELVSRGFKSVASANKRRQEAAARRDVRAELESVARQSSKPKPQM